MSRKARDSAGASINKISKEVCGDACMFVVNQGKVLVAGVVLSTLTCYFAWDWKEHIAADQFKDSASDVASSIEIEIQSTLSILNSLGGLFVASNHVDRKEFRTFVNALGVHRSVQALEWIPRVSLDERQIYEKRALDDGFADFSFTERLALGKMGVAKERKEYFPVYYVEPVAGNEAAIGFDLASNAPRRAALEKARDTGRPVATERISLVQETEKEFGFLVFMPIYRGQSESLTVEERRKRLLGFGLGVFRLPALVFNRFGKIELFNKNLSVQIIDQSSTNKNSSLLFSSNSDDQKNQFGSINLTKSIKFANREWNIIITTLHSSHSHIILDIMPWMILFAGIGLAIVVAHILEQQRNQARIASRIAGERTQDLKHTTLLLETTLDNIDQGVAVYDANLDLVVWSKGFERIMDFPRGWLRRGRNIRDYFMLNAQRGEYGDVDLEAAVDRRMSELKININDIKPHRYVRQRPDGRSIEITGRRMPDGGLVTTFTDVTDQRKAQLEVERLAWTDTLTGLYNRNSFRSKFLTMMRNADRGGYHLSIMFIDLDKFKPINDTYGHDVGDAVLREIGNRIKIAMRDSDIAARLGGDEFAAVLKCSKERDVMVTPIRRLLDRILAPIIIDDRSLTVGASMGIAFYPDDDTCVDELLRKADFALYDAKANGRGGYRIYDAEVDEKARKLRALEDDLRDAVRDDQFELYFQPKVSGLTGTLTGAEALIRWNHPTRGLIPPGEFIACAEHSDLVFPIGAWVLEEAMSILQGWQRYTDQSDFRLSVNLSGRQFFDSALLDLLQNLARSHKSLVDQMELEITEEIMLKDADEAAEILHQITEMGFCISIDDFGTGYSSFSYLHRLPVQKIKIDQSFIHELGESEQAETIVGTIIKLGHNLDMSVVAEGVENEQQVKFLRGQNCDELQGYYYARPMPQDDFKNMLKQELRKSA